MQVTIKTSGSYVEKWYRREKGVELTEAQELGFVLAAALYAVGPARLDEVLGHCVVALSDNGAFAHNPTMPSASGCDELCDAAGRIVDEWKQHDERPMAI